MATIPTTTTVPFWMYVNYDRRRYEGLLVRCPYNRAHRIQERSFSDHLLKCRNFYELQGVNALGKQEVEDDGHERPQRVSCRYNVDHRVFAPELLYHEHNCPDRKVVWLKQLYFQQRHLLESICRSTTLGLTGTFTDASLKVYEITLEEAEVISELRKDITSRPLAEIWKDGLGYRTWADTLIKMVQERPPPVLVPKVLCADAMAREKEVKTVELEEPTSPLEKIAMEHEVDSDDSWNLDDSPSRPVEKYDWWEHQLKYMKQTGRCPAGMKLTKGQKRKLLPAPKEMEERSVGSRQPVLVKNPLLTALQMGAPAKQPEAPLEETPAKQEEKLEEKADSAKQPETPPEMMAPAKQQENVVEETPARQEQKPEEMGASAREPENEQELLNQQELVYDDDSDPEYEIVIITYRRRKNRFQ